MKRFVLLIAVLVTLYIGYDYAYYRLGWYIDLHPSQAVSTFMRTQDDKIYQLKGSAYEEFEIKGVNLGSGKPGEWSTDFSIDKGTYLRWFANMQ